MSWLANLANSLGVDDESNNNSIHREKESLKRDTEDDDDNNKDPERGVKEDLSELTKTLTRQLWGVASFLAPPPSPSPRATSSSSSSEPLSHPFPPPPPPPPPPRSHSISDWNRWESSDQSVSDETSGPEVSESSRISGIRNDFAEIGGRFRTELSRFSNHKAVSEISKIASTFLPFGSEEESEDLIGGAVGVTKEVLAFARNISKHPETWLDFPLPDDEDSTDFDMSDAQQEHALAVEHLAPRLAALRIELCPGYMSEGCFWKIYFVLLHPRLNKHDAELLSTPQIVEARAMLTQDLQNRTKTHDFSGKGTSFSKDPTNSLHEENYSFPTENAPLKTFACDTSNFTSSDVETEKHPVVSGEMQIVDKSVVEEEPVVHKNKDVQVSSSSKFLDQKYDEDGDDWLEDESSEMMGFSGTNVPLGNEEDVSFSDLEDDEDDKTSMPAGSKAVTNNSNLSSEKQSQDWVQLQLNKNSSGSKVDPSTGTGQLSSPEQSLADHDNKDASDWLNVDKIDAI